MRNRNSHDKWQGSWKLKGKNFPWIKDVILTLDKNK